MEAGIIVLAYLIGSIPFSYLVARMFAKTDIRNVGTCRVLPKRR